MLNSYKIFIIQIYQYGGFRIKVEILALSYKNTLWL